MRSGAPGSVRRSGRCARIFRGPPPPGLSVLEPPTLTALPRSSSPGLAARLQCGDDSSVAGGGVSSRILAAFTAPLFTPAVKSPGPTNRALVQCSAAP